MDFNVKIEVESSVCIGNESHSKMITTNKSSSLNNKTETTDKMNSSLSSNMDTSDTSPSDSGVQMLDSESSELMIESITSQSAYLEEDDFGGKQAVTVTPAEQAIHIEEPLQLIKDSNSNVTTTSQATTMEDTMSASTCSTFDTTENIVYRRKIRKSPAAEKAPKKRVSFHEDILKNTRTDNIHIEHGFITYKNARKFGAAYAGNVAGRYSWCSEGEGKSSQPPSTLCEQENDENDEDSVANPGGNRRGRRVVYRNACSDVLDYGNYDTNESNGLQYDNTGVFEYVSNEETVREQIFKGGKNEKHLYQCSCSSNSSLDSDESDKNCNREEYGKAKSSSCDCIGSNANNNFIDENCYFSEPNIDNLKEQKSVWNKEKKPKSSCLKKTKRQTNIIHEQNLNKKIKKFNVHVDMNQLIDNSSKMLIGSLKSIFTMPLPERGVPEGSEDLQAVSECIPEPTPEHKVASPKLTQLNSPDSPVIKAKPFLSKSLDGSKKQANIKKFVHNVDEQLRRKNEEDVVTSSTQISAEQETAHKVEQQQQQARAELQRQDEIDAAEGEAEAHTIENQIPTNSQKFRNKFIINCESTVFEHTGVSYETQPFNVNDYNNSINSSPLAVQENELKNSPSNLASLLQGDTPIAQPERDHLRSSFISAPLAKTFSNFFRSFKDTSGASTSAAADLKRQQKQKLQEEHRQQMLQQQQATENYFAFKMNKPLGSSSPTEKIDQPSNNSSLNIFSPTSTSTISEFTNASNSSAPSTSQQSKPSSSSNNSLAIAQELQKQVRHLPSPLKKRNMSAQLPPRFAGVGCSTNTLLGSDNSEANMGTGFSAARGGSGRDSKSTILSEEFDDILTITTDAEKNESDIVFLDYSDLNDRSQNSDFLKPPQPAAAKTSLINRFLRNVTQKKMMDTSMRSNNFFASKLKNEQKLFAGNLYVRGIKPKNCELIDDLNTEIAMEIEMSSGINSPRRELADIDAIGNGDDGDLPGDISRFELGIGEISIEMFQSCTLNILRDSKETLMKVFKLYIGYSSEGFMTPVLVFLTDHCLYVADLVRNRLCSKFELAYVDLDIILMGPFGNTVLLSNSERDMQQVLLAGGPYPADELVANLELCARRGGSILPAVGQLTLQHLAPLQKFVRENCCVGTNETWMYYAVVNMPAGSLGSEKEPLGPHVKGFLMHRRIKESSSQGSSKHYWNPGYFLLKAGVLYMFNDSNQKLPSWAMALAECQGARRTVKSGRPHCFEIVLKGGLLLQLAAPDEYVASEWLQALLQSASGLFEMQEKHKTLGCTLVITQHHLITLREDFSAPLMQLNKLQTEGNLLKEESLNRIPQNNTSINYGNLIATPPSHLLSMSMSLKRQGIFLQDDNLIYTSSNTYLNSNMSTPTRGLAQSYSSMNSTPTKLSQLSRSTNAGGNSASSTSASASNNSKATQAEVTTASPQKLYSKMNSVYGRKSGLEILTCADIKEMTGIKVASDNDTWWCVLEFSCQEVRECTDDLVIFFASSTEMQRFLRLLEQLWQAKNNDLFPITVLDEDDPIAEQCTMLYMDINRSWEPLLSAALGYPL